MRSKSQDFLTVTQLAKTLGVTRAAIHKKIQKSQLKAERYGNSYLIPAKEFEAMMTRELTDKMKNEIERGVSQVIKEYGETLRLLGKE